MLPDTGPWDGNALDCPTLTVVIEKEKGRERSEMDENLRGIYIRDHLVGFQATIHSRNIKW
jgi:hypothetical protein